MHIPNVTLCCIDNQYTDLGFDALQKSTNSLSFEQVIYFTSPKFIAKKNSIKNLSIIPIQHINNLETYSNFMIKELNKYIGTKYVIIVQWDGFITHPNLWRMEFLNFDYIGAPWPTSNGKLVGNGGFSLRSKKLLNALQDEKITAMHPEDQCICIENRTYLEQAHQIRFAPGELAEQFAFELQKPAFDCFGFHAVCNLPLVLVRQDLIQMIHKLPSKLIFTEQFSQFIQACQGLNNANIMDELIKQILSLVLNMSKDQLSTRQYRHIIKTCIQCKIYSLALKTLTIRARVTGWNMDALMLLTRIYTHKLFHSFRKL